jgi:cystathionine beta-lyase/cystathionine gamma-synthase
MRFATKAIHSSQEPDKETGAVTTPIYTASTYAPNRFGYEYSRTLNPTRKALEGNLAALENAKYGSAFSSGMGAIDAVMKLLNRGDHVVVSEDVYGGTYRLFDKVLKRYGLDFSFVDSANLMNVEVAINKNTKLIWFESPTNPMLKINDIEGIVGIAKENDLISVIDNTFATPYLQNPLDMGIDLVVHSMTKYMGGHSDVVGGAVLTNNEDYNKVVQFVQNAIGAVPSPFDCFLVLRGIKTLALRMDRHCSNAQKIADHFKDHEKIKKVIYPGLEDHPQYELAKEQMRAFGGMVTFEMDCLENAKGCLENVKVFTFATSLGGVESLIDYPCMTTHVHLPEEDRLKMCITDCVVRLSVGIEDPEDLIEDLEQAMG